ncbi:hypothetical protein Tco_0179565 [Tanacetum coccineum]
MEHKDASLEHVVHPPVANPTDASLDVEAQHIQITSYQHQNLKDRYRCTIIHAFFLPHDQRVQLPVHKGTKRVIEPNQLLLNLSPFLSKTVIQNELGGDKDMERTLHSDAIFQEAVQTLPTTTFELINSGTRLKIPHQEVLPEESSFVRKVTIGTGTKPCMELMDVFANVRLILINLNPLMNTYVIGEDDSNVIPDFIKYITNDNTGLDLK